MSGDMANVTPREQCRPRLLGVEHISECDFVIICETMELNLQRWIKCNINYIWTMTIGKNSYKAGS